MPQYGNEEEKTLTYDKIKIRLASPEKIREWSRGEVKKPETDSRIFSTMERQQEFLIHSGSHLLFSLSSGFSLQEPDPDVTFMQSVLT